MTPNGATIARRTSRTSAKSLAQARKKQRESLGWSHPVKGQIILGALFSRLCREADTPFAYAAHARWNQGDIRGLLAMKVDPWFYTWNKRYAEFELDYAIAAFFKKFQDFDLGIDRREVAYAKWLEAERSCQQVNMDFRLRWEGLHKPHPFHVEEVYHLARRKISEAFSSVKPADMDFLRNRCRHGPGSDLSVGLHLASSYEKFRTRGAITEPCLRLYDEVFGNDPDYRQELAHEALIVAKSRLSFVPKTALTDRSICVEPRWNVFLQLGIGELISRRLRRFGLDPRSQTENQEGARAAWEDGLATVDLSAASDSIATNLVVDLLADCDPFWLDLILKSRCVYTQYKQKTHRLEKISSMGNGYTFPLETAIFYAFAWAATRFVNGDTSRVKVFGDDILVPRVAYSTLVESLAAFGFSVNSEKSYANGDFYESCGKDFYRGREVRPFFVKKSVRCLSDSYVLHNQLVDWASRNAVPLDTGVRPCRNARRLELAKLVATYIPKRLRFYGPTTMSGVLHGHFERWCMRPLARPSQSGWEGFEVRGFSSRAGYDYRYDFRGHLYSKLTADVNSGNRVLSRTAESHRLTWTLYSDRDDFVYPDESQSLSSCLNW